MDVVVITGESWEQLKQNLERMERLITQLKNPVVQKSISEKNMEEVENWIPLRLAWKKMGISKYQWYTNYQKIIKHRNYKGSTWVYLPSIIEFFESDSIN